MNRKTLTWFHKAFSRKRLGRAKKALPGLLLLLLPLALFFLLDALFPLPYAHLLRDYSTLHLTGKGGLLRITLSPSGKYRIKAPLSMMSPFLVKGIIQFEDKFFYFHPGINPAAVFRAVSLNVRKQRVVSGASTITLQLAKIMEPKERTLGSKLFEALRALQLEAKYPKDRILEMYLNSIPMGGNIEGVAAASYLYFNKSPYDLTPAEAALLIALPKSPGILKPGKNMDLAARARNEVLDRVFCGHIIPDQTCLAAKLEPVPRKRFRNPQTNPHLVNRRSISRDFIRVYTLNNEIQACLEHAVKTAIEGLKPYKVFNCSMIAVDNRTMNVVGYVGSPDFSDKDHWGEIDGNVILRSPGSALKPFIYAMAMDRGMITPKKTVYDIPVKYDTYAPFNFGKEFNGPVKVETALSRSLNCPAVEMEHVLGKNGLLSLMNALAFTGAYRKKLEPGLSIALGTYPVTLEELVMLYASLANGGEIKQLRYTAEKKEQKGMRLFSPEAAYIISTIISEAERPDLPQSWEFTQSRGRVAFKTGTSFGLRDAVCVGYNPDYTIGVWVGNADTSPSFKLIGIKAAAPIVIEVFNFLTRYKDSWFTKPEKVKTRQVCAVSGDVPGEYCKNTVEDYYIEGRTPKRVCAVHKAVYTDKQTGKTYAGVQAGKSAADYEMKIIEDWPPEVLMYLDQGKKAKLSAPGPAYDVPAMAGQKPKIISPPNHAKYIMNEMAQGNTQKIPLKAAAGAGITEIYWFVNGSAIGTTAPGETMFIEPHAGKIKIEIQDSAGATDKVEISVQNRGE